jgi:hypothetical protein
MHGIFGRCEFVGLCGAEMMWDVGWLDVAGDEGLNDVEGDVLNEAGNANENDAYDTGRK